MDKLDRIYQLHNILKNRRTPISRTDLEGRLDLPKSTTTRLIRYCRDRLHMPIECNKENGGYYYVKDDKATYELPGLWFSPSELSALMVSHHLLAKVQPGVLDTYIAPLQQRIEALLEHKRAGSREVFQRVRILPIANRIPHLENFQKAADALVKRSKLRMVYSGRGKEEVTERWVSPQRLVYYRDNWYLDAWCHLRKQLRTFSLERMQILETGSKAKDIPETQLNAHVTHAYGIFSGPATNKAIIHFSADAARWVADEEWHPEQQSRYLRDGKWELTIPYGNPTELIRDILKFGPEAEVVAPTELREQIKDRLSQALRKYRNLKKV